VRRLVRWLHVYAGLALSLLLFVLAVTGGALVYKEAYWRRMYPDLRAPIPAIDAAGHAAAIEAARRHFGSALRSVKLPEPGVNAYHLYLDDGEAFLSAVDHEVIDRWRPNERVMALLFDLHAHLMAGDAGERVGGVIGLMAAVMTITGLILWWPTRSQFSLRNLIPRNLARRILIAWHRDIGMLASPVLLLLLLTGSGLVFYTTGQRILNGIFGDPVPVMKPPTSFADGDSPKAVDAALLARVERVFPGARIVFYYPPRDGISYHQFRVKQACELHPNGRSYVYVDARGEELAAIDACALPPGEKAMHAIYPLHAGKASSSLYKFVTFLGAVALAILSASGVVTYLQRIFGTLRRSRRVDMPRRARAAGAPRP